MGARTNGRGDTLDPQVEVMLRLQGAARGWQDVPSRRASMERGCFLGAANAPKLETVDLTLAGCPVRRYDVPGATGALVYLHGGGWVVGSLQSHDAVCRRLAKTSGRTVFAVDYPLAPEHPWPAAVHAVEAVWNELDRSKWTTVVLGGDSAGGNLTAAVARLVTGIHKQFLLYPGLDATLSQPSHAEFGDQRLILEGSAIELYLDLYAPAPLDPLASPVLADDLTGLPPAVIAVAGFDPLRDEALWYARRLQEAGVPVQLFEHRGLPHGYANFDGLVDAAAAAMDELGAALRD